MSAIWQHACPCELPLNVDCRRCGATSPRYDNPAPGRPGLTHEQIAVACKNVGVDLSCGQCASVFYTGSGTYPHTCEAAADAKGSR